MTHRLRGIYVRRQPAGAHRPWTTFRRSYPPESWWVEWTVFLPFGVFVSVCWSRRS